MVSADFKDDSRCQFFSHLIQWWCCPCPFMMNRLLHLVWSPYDLSFCLNEGTNVYLPLLWSNRLLFGVTFGPFILGFGGPCRSLQVDIHKSEHTPGELGSYIEWWFEKVYNRQLTTLMHVYEKSTKSFRSATCYLQGHKNARHCGEKGLSKWYSQNIAHKSLKSIASLPNLNKQLYTLIQRSQGCIQTHSHGLILDVTSVTADE